MNKFEETIVNTTKLLFSYLGRGIVYLLRKRDKYRTAAGKDPFLPY
jgi:hypothetical protein